MNSTLLCLCKPRLYETIKSRLGRCLRDRRGGVRLPRFQIVKTMFVQRLLFKKM